MQTQRFPRTLSKKVWSLAAGIALSGLLTPAPLCRADARHVITVTAEQAHDWEMQLEIQLLSDPLTFPYGIRPQISQHGMELHGQVPNVWVRDHVLKLATSASPVSVVDNMTVDPKLPIPIAQPQGASFATEARSRLERVGAKLSGPIEIRAAGNGQIVLAGTISSVEDKAKLSLALRGLPGCTCVKNELAIAGISEKTRESVKVAAPVRLVAAQVAERTQGMPPSPVQPARGTLASETAFASGSAALVRSNEDGNTQRVVPVSATADAAQRATAPVPAAETRATVKTPNGPPTPQAQAAIQKKLLGILGRNVRDIAMQFDDKGGAKIRVKVAKLADVEKVHAAIQSSTELAGYDVNVEFIVGH